MNRLQHFFLVFLVIILSNIFACLAQVWTPESMLNMRSIKNIQISPDHKSALFVVTECQDIDGKKSYRSRIYKKMLDKNSPPLVISPGDSSCTLPKWSPDGRQIAFLKDDVLSVCDSDGNHVIEFQQPKFEVQTYSWSPDSKQIAFVMKDLRKDSPQKNVAFTYKEKVYVNRLWILDVAKPLNKPKALTSDDYHLRGNFLFTEEEFDWSPDGQHITFAYNDSASTDQYFLEGSIATIDLATDRIKNWPKLAQQETMPRYSPDGKWIAYQSSDQKSSFKHDKHIVIVTTDREQVKPLNPTYNQGGTSIPNLIGWTTDSQHILFFEPKKTKAQLLKVPIHEDKIEEIAISENNIKELSLGYDHHTLGFVAQSCDCPPEAFLVNLDSLHSTQLSHLNDSFKSFPSIKTEIIRWKAKDGMEIEGLLSYPLDYREGQRYPLLVVIHGGPMIAADEIFLGTPGVYPLAAFVQNGFFVFRPNYRGSSGYGKTFRHLNYQDWAGKDFEDIISGLDTLIEQGKVDPQRLGIMGWSYGGYLTAWAITQTDRFKAASIGAPITNLVSFSGTTDIPQFTIDSLGEFWKNPQLYTERSPVFFAAQVKTPCLLQHGLADVRVPITQSYEFYHALKLTGKDVKLQLYPEMRHCINNPEFYLDLMNKNLAWFTSKLIHGSQES